MQKVKFFIPLPPPNLTGSLHMGHGLGMSIMDFITRSHQILGYDAAILPGYDHGGISTETSAYKKLNIKVTDSFEDKMNSIQQFALGCKDSIREQIDKMNLLMDWTKEQYTLDEDYKNLVEDTFITLFHKGHIYRGLGLVNYDPMLGTSISDLEVQYNEEKGFLYQIPYKTTIGEDLIVSTTRPETIFGDTALFVNPKDPRYENFIGEFAYIPFINKQIPIMSDDYVDMEYGTGVLKVTPAHDENDYKLYLKYNLDIVNIMDSNLNIITNHATYGVMTMGEARDLVASIAVKIEPIIHKVPYSSKTNAKVEKKLMDQWFMKLTDIGKRIVEKNQLLFVQEQWKNDYLNWLNNLNDWCLSRNITWGHRIPAWTKDGKNWIVCKTSPGDGYQQTTEVLDTWFSSGLWVLSYKDRYGIFPVNILVTGYDILFFWVARMMIMSELCEVNAPFPVVFLHQLVRDNQGIKMSKTRGNVKDPIEICDNYSSDLFKFTMNSLVFPTGNISFSDDMLTNNHKLLVKLQNLVKFCHLKPINEVYQPSDVGEYFLYKTKEYIKLFTENVVKFQIHKVIFENRKFLYFICDWLVEWSKIDYNLYILLKTTILPIILKGFYSSFPAYIMEQKIEIDKFNVPNGNNNDDIELVFNTITVIRSLQNYGVKIDITIGNFSAFIAHMCKCKTTEIYNFSIYNTKMHILNVDAQECQLRIDKIKDEIDKLNFLLTKTNNQTPVNIIDDRKKQLEEKQMLYINLTNILNIFKR